MARLLSSLLIALGLWVTVASAASLPLVPLPGREGPGPASLGGTVPLSGVVPLGAGSGAPPPGAPYTLELAVFRADPAARQVVAPLLVKGNGAAVPGEPEAPLAFLAVTLRPVAPGVSLYASAGQTAGKPTEVSATFDNGALVSPVVLFPRGAEKPDPLNPAAVTRIFEGPVTALVPLALDRNFEGRTVTVQGAGLACSAVNCTPFRLSGSIVLPREDALTRLPAASAAPWWPAVRTGIAETVSGLHGSGPSPEKDQSFREEDVRTTGTGFSPEGLTPVPFLPGLEVASLGRAVFFGFLAGLILNLMPCVLPVIGIKLAAMLGGGNTPQAMRAFRRHQIFFALGILAWFAVMALLVSGLDLAWGQVFQSPGVVLGLAVLLLLLALSLFGVLNLPLVALTPGGTGNHDVGAFANGFAATLLATPCGGPLLGGVLGWAFTQPFGIMALALGSVGLGMASPYLLLALFPGLGARLPRPGAWMGVMQRVIGFLLLGTVAYLVSLLPQAMLPRVGAALVLAGFGGWLWGVGATAGDRARQLTRLGAVACIAFACYWPLAPRPASVDWIPYTPAGMSELIGKRIVLVDFTADWCPTCKVVEATALAGEAVRTWQEQYNLALVRVDLTRNNPEGEALLRALGSASIPVIAVFGPEAPRSPLVLRDVVTRGQVAAALERAATKK